MSDDEKADDLPDTQPTDVLAASGPPTSETAAAGRAAGTSATKPIPIQQDAKVPETTEVVEPVVVAVQTPKKKRRRWPWVLGAILFVLVILLVVAFFVAESYAKDYARDYIKQRIVAVLGIEDPSQVKVDIGSGSVLLQALAGRLNEVDVDAGTVTFGVLTGEATVHAEGVPLDANAATEKLEVTFAVAEDQIVSVVSANLGGQQIDSITLKAPEVVVEATLHFFILEVPVGMGLEPSAEDGQIVLTPTSALVLGETFSIEDATDRLRGFGLGGVADLLFAQQRMCVNESLPVALTIVDVDVVKKALVVKINGDGVVMGGTDLSTPGTCAAG
jgi:hypothetical protein